VLQKLFSLLVTASPAAEKTASGTYCPADGKEPLLTRRDRLGIEAILQNTLLTPFPLPPPFRQGNLR
jgi:hypothetical protein